MTNLKWTKEQKKVIDLRKRNILVSAAAGSGKTAVLVERIITMITEGKSPIDIDHLLVVTFTNAAAAEMRERILIAIEKKLSEQPDHVHLQKQSTLIHTAQITTIHSFCLNVIRNHFNTIDLDPAFRIAEEAELVLIKADVMEILLESYYKNRDENFIHFVESYSIGKTDLAIEEMILQLYEFSISYPYPFDWLEGLREMFLISTEEQLNKTDWMKELLVHFKLLLQDLSVLTKQAINIAEEPGGPYPYLAALDCDAQWLDSVSNLQTYQQYESAFTNIKFARLSAKRDDAIDIGKKEKVKKIRTVVKKQLEDIKKKYFFQSMEQMNSDIQKVAPIINVLIDLTIDFSKSYTKKKREKNIVDFPDLEHFALEILVTKKEGILIPSLVAMDLAQYYEEILIDEYQDSATRC